MNAPNSKPLVKRECRFCGKLTARTPNTGKKHVAHKCPHGIPCTRGHSQLGWHANRPASAGPTYCPQCVAEFNRKERESNALNAAIFGAQS